MSLGDSPELRSRSKKSSSSCTPGPEVLVGKFVDTDPIAILKGGVKTVRHHKLGWLKEDLLASGTLDGSTRLTRMEA